MVVLRRSLLGHDEMVVNFHLIRDDVVAHVVSLREECDKGEAPFTYNIVSFS